MERGAGSVVHTSKPLGGAPLSLGTFTGSPALASLTLLWPQLFLLWPHSAHCLVGHPGLPSRSHWLLPLGLYFYVIFSFLSSFLYSAVPSLSYCMQDLVPRPGIEPWYPALGAQRLTPGPPGKYAPPPLPQAFRHTVPSPFPPTAAQIWAHLGGSPWLSQVRTGHPIRTSHTSLFLQGSYHSLRTNWFVGFD